MVNLVLTGSRCNVRPWRRTDAAALVKHANNPNVARQLRDRFPHPYTIHDAHAFLRSASAAQVPENFAIEVDGESAGGIGYSVGTDIERYSAEIGYWLSEALWGRGVATEALTLVTAHLFASKNLLRVFALPFAENGASIRVLEKAGYVREGLLRSATVKHGLVRDQLLLARINEHWCPDGL